MNTINTQFSCLDFIVVIFGVGMLIGISEIVGLLKKILTEVKEREP